MFNRKLLKNVFGKYARLPEIAGNTFLPLGFFARLPMAMLTIAALTITTATTGSYALGGVVAGAVGVGAAAGATVVGYLCDRLGQKVVLIFAAFLNTLFTFATIFFAYQEGFFWVLVVVAFLLGATIPQVGSLARARWIAMSVGDTTGQDIDIALSYESTADELTFVFGPAVVGLLASFFAPWLALVVAAFGTITLVVGFALHPTEKFVGKKVLNKDVVSDKLKTKIFSLPIVLLVFALLCVGTIFGGLQNALNAFSGNYGKAEHAGLLYAIMGVGSVISALSVPYWSAKFVLLHRWLVCSATLLLTSFLFLLPLNVELVLLVLFVSGLSVGPVLVTVFGLAGFFAPFDRQTTVMTALSSGIVAGTSVGAASAGFFAQKYGYQSAFVSPVLAAFVLFLLACLAKTFLAKTTFR